MPRRASVSPPVRPSGWSNRTTAPGGSVRCEGTPCELEEAIQSYSRACFPSQVASPLKGKDRHPWSSWGEVPCTTPVPLKSDLRWGRTALQAYLGSRASAPASPAPQRRPASAVPTSLASPRAPDPLPAKHSELRLSTFVALCGSFSVSQHALPQVHRIFKVGGSLKMPAPLNQNLGVGVGAKAAFLISHLPSNLYAHRCFGTPVSRCERAPGQGLHLT